MGYGNCCTDDCVLCDSKTTCARCRTGYREIGGKCKKCEVDNCKKCEDDFSCEVCEGSYFLMMPNKGKCVPFTDCKGWGLYRDVIKRTCHRCKPHCKTCRDQSTCQFCVDGYYLSASGMCERCSSNPNNNCLKCLDDCQCTLCEADYYLKKNEDGSIVCDPCTSAGLFKMEKERKCVNCAPNCNICKDANNCSECACDSLNVYILDMRTKRCVVIEECDSCGIPPLVKYEDNTKCGRCSENCKTCTDPDTVRPAAVDYCIL